MGINGDMKQDVVRIEIICKQARCLEESPAHSKYSINMNHHHQKMMARRVPRRVEQSIIEAPGWDGWETVPEGDDTGAGFQRLNRMNQPLSSQLEDADKNS